LIQTSRALHELQKQRQTKKQIDKRIEGSTNQGTNKFVRDSESSR